MNVSELQQTILFQKIAVKFEGDFCLDEPTRKIYATDASVYQEIPKAVAIPKSEADIELVIQLANQTGIGIIPRTAGTSLAGQVVGGGIVLDLSRHFTKILEINSKEKWVRVQPGVIRNELNAALEAFDLVFGPETSTGNRAMMGGMLGNNSCGSNSIVYGSMRDHTLEVTGFMSDGNRTTFREIPSAELTRLAKNPTTLKQSIYAGLHEIFSSDNNRQEIHRGFPKATVSRRNTGYALDAMVDCQPYNPSGPPFNLCKLIAGSEGTLFLATEIKLRCHALPPKVAGLLCVHLETVDQALRASLVAMSYSPFACELIDRLILEGAARNINQRQNLGFVSGDPGAILVIEIRGNHQDEVLVTTSQIQSELELNNLGYHFPVLFEPETKKVWELRKAGLGVVSNVPGDSKPCTVIEDTAVALEDLPAYIAEMHQLLSGKYGLDCVHYAHAGAGEIHLRPVLNLKTESGRKLFRQVAADVASLVKKWNGSLSGEHGDGRLRGEFLREMIGPTNYELCRKVKELWDPQNIFNPGKIVNAPPMDQDLRFPIGKLIPSVDTVFDFSETQGLLGAAEMCSGSGDCRKTHLAGGTMCPSYMATRNEFDSTRARANLLRQALTSPSNAQWPLDNQEVKNILDLCLSCKACKSECPSNVDMAKIKAEVTQAHYDRHGIPLRARLIANYARLNRWMSVAPSFYNWAASNPVTSRWIKSFCGFHPQRSLPKLASQTLSHWLQKHSPPPHAGSVGEVTLFCDEFTNYNDLEAGRATVELLENLGYRVQFVKHDESGRAAISKGLLRKARSIAERNVAALADKISDRNPLIGIEPSAILTFRDEYVSLLRGAQATIAKRLSVNCLLLDEFISQQTSQGNIRPTQFTDHAKVIRLHGHCHQKAIASLAPTVQMLQLPKNYRVRLIPSGCCGMAGSFGYEREHYETANRIGELVLMPTIRAEPEENLIAATGTSCRHQILDATGRLALHPAQILRNALLPAS